jgi:hypothetical protein
VVKAYLGEVVMKDASVNPGKALVAVCQRHGWGTFRRELEVVFKSTATATLERSVRLLEQVCLAKPRKKDGWTELCATAAQATLQALETVDQETAANDWQARGVNRPRVLTSLARSLLASDQFELLSRLVAHTLARPEEYPLTEAHVSALTTLEPWLAKNVEKPCPALSHWLASCCEQLEALTAREPQAPADYRRDAAIRCPCGACAALRRFLEDPHERVYRHRAAQDQRTHLEHVIRQHHCDLDLQTEESGRPYTLVCTKNTASYRAKLHKYRQDQEHLLALRSIEVSLPE